MYQTNKLAESKLIMGNGRTPIALSPGPKAKKSVRGAESKSGKKENSDSNMSLHG